MPLPVIPLATGEIELAGQRVEYHAVSLGDALKINNVDPANRGAMILGFALGISIEEALEWLEKTPIEPATELLTAIVELSGLEDEVTIRTDDGPKG